MLANFNKIQDCTIIGDTQKMVSDDTLKDCYIIHKDSIKDITEHFQGVKHIITKPNFEVK